jgi:hypothetical protein
MVEVVALFTDNDQTGEPVEAYYGAIRALSDNPMDAQYMVILAEANRQRAGDVRERSDDAA